MVYCAAVDCNNNSFKNDKNVGISFFRLPQDKCVRKHWIASLKRENLPKPENDHVFHLHFENCASRETLR